MTRATRNVSLTQDHCDLIARVAHERRMRFSEALRVIIDFACDRDAALGLPFHADRVKRLQTELLSAQEAIKSLEQQEKPVSRNNTVLEQVPESVNGETRVVPKASFTDKRPGLTEQERFLKAAPYVANGDKMVTPELKIRVLAQVKAHPEWLQEIPDQSQKEKLAILAQVGSG